MRLIKFFTLLSACVSFQGVNAAALYNAKVLENKTWVSGADEKGMALSGHFESAGDVNAASMDASAYNACGGSIETVLQILVKVTTFSALFLPVIFTGMSVGMPTLVSFCAFLFSQPYILC